jgi:short-chain fatty acids transporter
MDAPVRAESRLAALAQISCTWCERWFPDAYVFAVVAVAVVVIAALLLGAPPAQVAASFGDGYWGLIPFTMQMTFIIIGGYVTADSPPVSKLIRRLGVVPRTGRSAVMLVALFAMLVSLIHWGLALILASLLVRAIAQRSDLRLDYRAAGAAACLGMGSVWALGLSSSAAQLQANAASMPPAMRAITGLIPFTETIFLWQSMLLAAVVIAVSTWTAYRSAPDDKRARVAQDLGVSLESRQASDLGHTRPGEWLEHSPIPNALIVVLAATWLVQQVAAKGLLVAISSLNTYNLVFIMLGLLLHWTPRRFIDSVMRSVPNVASILIQFPLMGAIAAILTGAADSRGATLATALSDAFTHVASHGTFALFIGIYSAVLGLFIPSGGGKWVIEAPYVMQAAANLHYNLGWTVQIYNAAEALPNLINPFWMLPVLGVLGLKARDLIGYSFIQFLINTPLVLFLLWLLGGTLSYHPATPVP